MPSQKRHATIYDLAALKLHRDGSKASSSATRNTRTVTDALGNVMARDASGKFDRITKNRAPSRRRGSSRSISEDMDVDESEQVEIDEDNQSRRGESSDRNDFADLSDQDIEHSSKTTGSRKRKSQNKAYRSKRRRLYDEDLDFLDATLASPADDVLPDSDLLKFIHYYAAKRYESEGLMLDLAHRHREVLKRARTTRSGQLSEAAEDPTTFDEASTSSKGSGEAEVTTPPAAKATLTRYDREDVQKDMYQAFTGDLLLALGIILQEDIAFHLTVKGPPDGWDDLPEVDEEFYDGSEDEDEQEQDSNENQSEQVEGAEEDEEEQGDDDDDDDDGDEEEEEE